MTDHTEQKTKQKDAELMSTNEQWEADQLPAQLAPGTIEQLPAMPSPGWLPAPSSFDEALRFADMLSQSTLVPTDYRGHPGDILIAVQMGMDCGLSWAQALQNIAVINGRPCMWGDAVLAVVRGSGLLEDIQEWWNEDETAAYCRVKRKGAPRAVERSFTLQDAKHAKLTDKTGPWRTYPTRMLQMRARGWALRDEFPDALKGIAIREEVMDIEVIDTTTGEVTARRSKLRDIESKTQQRTAKVDDQGQSDGVDPQVIRDRIDALESKEDVAQVAAMLNRVADNGERRELGQLLTAAAKKVQ